jgi:hypothetical protein
MYYAVLSGDLIKSSKISDGEERELLTTKLKECLREVTNVFELSRGDFYQAVIENCENSIWSAVYIRCFLKTILKPGITVKKVSENQRRSKITSASNRSVFVDKNGIIVKNGTLGIDSRVAIGIGSINYKAKKIAESDGTAYHNSGRLFDDLKKGQNLTIKTNLDEENDKSLNLICMYLDHIISGWTFHQAEVILDLLRSEENGLKQSELAEKYGISQPSLNQRIHAANWGLLKKSIDLSREIIHKENI